MSHQQTLARLRQRAEAGQPIEEREVRKLVKNLEKSRDALWDDYLAARDAAIPPEAKARIRQIEEEYQPALEEVADLLQQAITLLSDITTTRLAEEP